MKRTRPRPNATGSHRVAPFSLAQLERRIGGRVLTPANEGYAAAVWPAGNDAQPAVVVMPASASDVAVAMSFAASHHLAVATRPTAGALQVVPTQLARCEIDPDNWTARVEPGVTGLHVLREAGQLGLAAVLDTEPGNGVVDNVVDGGAGWLARRFGLGIGHIRGVELVTADGTFRSASREEDPAVFRGLAEGDRDAVGVITALDLDLVPVGPVHAGDLGYDGGQLRSVVERYRRWIDEAPVEMTASLNLAPASEHSTVIVRGCHLGTGGDSPKLLDFWRRWRTPVIDSWVRSEFADFAAAAEPPRSGRRLSATYWLRDLEPDLVAGLADLLSPVVGDEAPHMDRAQIIDLGPNSRVVTSGLARSRWCLTLSGSVDDPVGIAALAAMLVGVARQLPIAESPSRRHEA